MEENNTEKVEDIFNVNKVLTTLFSSIKITACAKNIELIYEMDSTVPRKLRGDPEALLQLLTKMLTFVFQNTDRKEIVLSLSAPDDFVYEEFISFRIKETNITKERTLIFLETNLSQELKLLDGKIIYDEKNISDICLSIPFKNIELGFRRHYRLPNKTIVGKKILLLCANEKTAQSLKNMFEYFLYDVHIGFDEFKKYGNDLTTYNILIISEKIITEEFKKIIIKAQEYAALKYVLFQEYDVLEDNDIKTDSENFVKPITQEKIFDLIVSLFNDEIETDEI